MESTLGFDQSSERIKGSPPPFKAKFSRTLARQKRKVITQNWMENSQANADTQTPSRRPNSKESLTVSPD